MGFFVKQKGTEMRIEWMRKLQVGFLVGVFIVGLFGCGSGGGGGNGAGAQNRSKISFHAPTTDVPALIADTPTVLTTTVFVPVSEAKSKASAPAQPQPIISLEHLDSNDVVTANFGNFHDDGLNGDADEGDGVFSIQVTLTEQGPDPIRFRVSAIIDPSSPPTVSGVITIPVYQIPSINSSVDYNRVVDDLFVNLINIRDGIVSFNGVLSDSSSATTMESTTTLLRQIIDSSTLAYTEIVALKMFESESSQRSPSTKVRSRKSLLAPGLVQDVICAIPFLGGGCTISDIGQVGLRSENRMKLFVGDENRNDARIKDGRIKDVIDWALQHCGIGETEITGGSEDPSIDRELRLACWKRYEFALDSPSGANKELITIGTKFEIGQAFSPATDAIGNLLTTATEVGKIVVQTGVNFISDKVIDWYMDKSGQERIRVSEISDSQLIDIPAGTHNLIILYGGDAAPSVVKGVTVSTDGPVLVSAPPGSRIIYSPNLLPSAPTGVTADSGNSQVVISWGPVSKANSYNLYWSTSSPVNKASGNRIQGVTSPYIHIDRTNGVTYYYVVTAENANGESAISNQRSATPSTQQTQPRNVSALPGNGLNLIRWASVSGATNYNIYFGHTPGVTKETGTRIISNATGTFYHFDLTNDTTYYYVVTAIGPAGESGQSLEVSATPSISATHITTLASGLSSPSGIKVDTNYAYWAEPGVGIKKAPVAGGDPTTVRSGNVGPWIEIDNTYIYWTESGGTGADVINKMAKEGGAVTTLTNGLTAPRNIVADGANLYWMESPGNIKQVSVSGGVPTTLASAWSLGNLATDSTYVYWTEALCCGSATALKKVPVGGGGTITLGTGPGIGTLAVDETYVYYSMSDGISGGISRIPKEGGTSVRLASGLFPPVAMAVDSTHVYWINGGSVSTALPAIMKVPKDGGTLVTLASGEGICCGLITLDASNVYWTEPGGSSNSVRKVPKGQGSVKSLTNGLTAPRNIVTDGANLYWMESPGLIRQLPILGGTTITVRSFWSGGSNVVTDGAYIYWTEFECCGGNAHLKRTPVGGGDAITLANGTFGSVAIDNTYVYFGAAPSSGISKVPKEGGDPVPLTTGVVPPSDIAVDSTNVYWLGNSTGTTQIMKVPKNGGTVATLATASPVCCGQIVLDASDLYWTELTGNVNKVPINGGPTTAILGKLSGAAGIAVDSAYIYWVEPGIAVKRMSLSGGQITILALGNVGSWIAISGSSIYWTESGGSGADVIKHEPLF